MISASIDTHEIESVGPELKSGVTNGLRETIKRGAEIMREEAPEASGRLRKGIKPVFDEEKLSGQIEVTAVRPAQPAREETLSLGRGRTKVIKFAAQGAFDYARAVAEGTGVYGARGQAITPQRGRKLRFVVNGRAVFADQVEGQRPNPYPERTVERLEAEIPGIFDVEIGRALA